FVYDAVRTPFGKFNGGLAGVRPDDLAAVVLGAVRDRTPGLDPEAVDEVILGNANGAGEENRNVARMAVLLAGLPTSIPGVTVNRLCASSLEAAIAASRAVECGDASLILTGGVESMSRAPWVLAKPEKGFPRGDDTLYSTTLGWRLVNPRMPERWTISLGLSTEGLADRYGISREAQDAFAVRSHRLAAAAWDERFYDAWVVPAPETELRRDEIMRPDTSVEALAKLRPAFRRDGGTVTAGNSSALNDGAAAVLIGSAAAAEAIGREPLARIAGRAASGVDPDVFGIGPVQAVNRALRQARIGWDDVAVLELNEAFAAQSLACLAEWTELDPERVNVNGGAIALGHPLGASGARVLATCAYELRRRGGGYGVAALCIGVGQGLAVVLEA
ncbi:MAG: thiolase family protein, partial [Conexibacter sp.]